MNLTFDGSIWEIFSTIGTVAAAWLAYSVVRSEKKKRISILIGSKNSESKEIMTDRDINSLLYVSAYNSGKSAVGLTFLGFWVKKDRKKVRFLNRNKLSDKFEQILYLSDFLKSTEMELLKPESKSQSNIMEKQYLLDVGKKYIDNNNNLIVYVVYQDFDRKMYHRKIILSK